MGRGRAWSGRRWSRPQYAASHGDAGAGWSATPVDAADDQLCVAAAPRLLRRDAASHLGRHERDPSRDPAVCASSPRSTRPPIPAEQWGSLDFRVCPLLLETLLEGGRDRSGASKLDALDSLMRGGPRWLTLGPPAAPVVEANWTIARLREAQGDIPGALAAIRRRENNWYPAYLWTLPAFLRAGGPARGVGRRHRRGAAGVLTDTSRCGPPRSPSSSPSAIPWSPSARRSDRREHASELIAADRPTPPRRRPRRPLPHRAGARRRAAWPRSTWPRTSSTIGWWRSRCSGRNWRR